jgi:hypothetical protein
VSLMRQLHQVAYSHHIEPSHHDPRIHPKLMASNILDALDIRVEETWPSLVYILYNRESCSSGSLQL